MSGFQEHASYVTKHGLARTNRFRVLIPLPAKMVEEVVSKDKDKSKLAEAFGEAVKIIKIFTGSSSNELTRGLDLMCNQTELPGKNINLSEAKYNGDTYKMGHSFLYGQHQFTFKVTSDMHEKNIVDEWMRLVVDPHTHEVGYYSDYVKDIDIIQLDLADNPVHAIKLLDAYPVMLNPLTLSNAESNNVHELMVQFAYRSWRNIELDTEGNEQISSLLQTPLGPYLAPILSNPVVQRGLDYIENATGIDLEGEAINIYRQVDDIVRATTGSSVNKTTSLLLAMKAAVAVNDKITNLQIAQLMDLIDGTLEKLR